MTALTVTILLFFSSVTCTNGYMMLNQYVSHSIDGCFQGLMGNDSNPLEAAIPLLLSGCLPYRLNSTTFFCLYLEQTLWNTTHVTKFNQYTTQCTRDAALCDYGSEECFSPDRFCMFERNIYGGPVHCSDTEHLRFCKSHQCPDSYKCNNSYCIPIHMVCDQVLDCPDGEDEEQCDDLTVGHGMFR